MPTMKECTGCRVKVPTFAYDQHARSFCFAIQPEVQKVDGVYHCNTCNAGFKNQDGLQHHREIHEESLQVLDVATRAGFPSRAPKC